MLSNEQSQNDAEQRLLQPRDESRASVQRIPQRIKESVEILCKAQWKALFVSPSSFRSRRNTESQHSCSLLHRSAHIIAGLQILSQKRQFDISIAHLMSTRDASGASGHYLRVLECPHNYILFIAEQHSKALIQHDQESSLGVNSKNGSNEMWEQVF